MNQIMTEDQLQKQLVLERLEKNKWADIWYNIKKNWIVYLLVVPVVLFFFFFRYLPIQGILVAFKEHKSYTDPILASDWTGFVGLYQLVFSPSSSPAFWQAFRNTFTLSMYGLIFGFPVPIILALFFSEIKNNTIRATTQVLSYLPNFLSVVVVTSLITMMFAPSSAGGKFPAGIFAQIFDPNNSIAGGVLTQASFFRPVYIISGIWEGSGYGSIVYFAAIMAISPTSYEAAKIDGANKLAQIKYVTFPGMAPTLTIMLILRIGSILSVGFEKVILLAGTNYNEIMTTAEVLTTYSARLGGLGEGATTTVAPTARMLASAADLFNSLIGMFLVLGANFISRRVSDTSLF